MGASEKGTDKGMHVGACGVLEGVSCDAEERVDHD